VGSGPISETYNFPFCKELLEIFFGETIVGHVGLVDIDGGGHLWRVDVE